MTQLSVNVNKLATLRNSREKNRPDVTALARRILEFGAHGITVHPRPDGRHIRLPDVWALQALIAEWNAQHERQVEFNIEGYPSEEFLNLLQKARPHQATLVPDPPEALTSNAGWHLTAHEALLRSVSERLRAIGCRTSLFVDPARFTREERAALARLKPERIELYTEAYAEHFRLPDRGAVAAIYQETADWAKNQGIGINAGHDLSQENLGFLLEQIPWLKEVSIGHALICEALEQGMEATVKAYLEIIKAHGV